MDEVQSDVGVEAVGDEPQPPTTGRGKEQVVVKDCEAVVAEVEVAVSCGVGVGGGDDVMDVADVGVVEGGVMGERVEVGADVREDEEVGRWEVVEDKEDQIW